MGNIKSNIEGSLSTKYLVIRRKNNRHKLSFSIFINKYYLHAIKEH